MVPDQICNNKDLAYNKKLPDKSQGVFYLLFSYKATLKTHYFELQNQ